MPDTFKRDSFSHSPSTGQQVAQAIRAVRSSNTAWLGYRYILFSIPNAGLFTEAGIELASLPAAGVSEIIFPTMTVALRKIPSLSTVDRYIPHHISNSQITLKAPTTRAGSFWDRIDLQIRALKEPGLYKNVPESFVIGEFEANTLLDLLPISIWAIRGAQATSFTPAPANSQGGSGSVPLEEIRMQVDSILKL